MEDQFVNFLAHEFATEPVAVEGLAGLVAVLVQSGSTAEDIENQVMETAQDLYVLRPGFGQRAIDLAKGVNPYAEANQPEGNAMAMMDTTVADDEINSLARDLSQNTARKESDAIRAPSTTKSARGQQESKVQIVGASHHGTRLSSELRRTGQRDTSPGQPRKSVKDKASRKISQPPRVSILDRLGPRAVAPAPGPMVSAFPVKSNRDQNIIRDQQGRKVRCPHWPNCNQRNTCQYHHPIKLCPNIANCPYNAQTCEYIHPQAAPLGSSASAPPTTIACKFGLACTRANCPFSHPSPATTDSRPNPATIPCRFFPNCRNSACPFFHPTNSTQPSEAQSIPKRNIMCRFLDNCTRPDCHFNHPRDGAIDCRFGASCTRPNCPYAHTTAPSAEGEGNKSHISERPFATSAEESLNAIANDEPMAT
ncbi:hypothetical protein IWQ62_002734 [Dispira parvispora]|uniref:C3H1-type domain-containing protein n=1 Tax=Dispira parvispora TaxID=1520584 RepID=A0A9W8AV40_9FUNG|nr:hypothetical protein IWQ62_002734 [Dispira parvispora]